MQYMGNQRRVGREFVVPLPSLPKKYLLCSPMLGSGAQ